MPFAFGPTVGNCFVTCLLNEPIARENMADIYKCVHVIDAEKDFKRIEIQFPDYIIYFVISELLKIHFYSNVKQMTTENFTV